ncbi:methyltransferase domain-containing protein [Streptomyces sp. SP17BM10]|uniref:methyltransferase domain-containing protein n=1 Tax=Streptomyces sp. SP17BM10 TaxID=3002530 RepID=UPI002E7A37D7|nr:methyltransferase domain-containing protein [Streptomyces sp. SP17BM10]MEE1783086.1 methyltransferase domain-containing protein [Streptomyces sp. SP17BM10]
MTSTAQKEGRPFPGRPARTWDAAFTAVPRSLFLPDLMWAHDLATNTSRAVSRTADPDGWAAAAAADIPIVTQWDDGRHHGEQPGSVPTSSASQPSVVAAMLEHLDVEAGQRVLEVGTGTGWNSALLSHRLGDANVVTVEIDPDVTARARTALHEAGYRPTVVCGDGAAGWPPGAPYDRIVATCALREVPHAWIRQARPGALILTPWGTHYSNLDALLRLEVDDDGATASGRFLEPVEFMKLRSQRLTWPEPPGGGGTLAEGSTTTTPPDHGRHAAFTFLMGLLLDGVTHAVQPYDDGARTLWLYSLTEPAWSATTFRDGEREHQVRQYGARRLWEEFETAYAWWTAAGQPGLARFGLTVTPDGQRLWLDDPAQLLPR